MSCLLPALWPCKTAYIRVKVFTNIAKREKAKKNKIRIRFEKGMKGLPFTARSYNPPSDVGDGLKKSTLTNRSCTKDIEWNSTIVVRFFVFFSLFLLFCSKNVRRDEDSRPGYEHVFHLIPQSSASSFQIGSYYISFLFHRDQTDASPLHCSVQSKKPEARCNADAPTADGGCCDQPRVAYACARHDATDICALSARTTE